MAGDVYGLNVYPWEMLPTETNKSYAAFLTYRDLGPRRTLREAASAFYNVPQDEMISHGGKVRTFEKWSSRFSWVHRVERWDDHTRQLADAATEQAIISMKERHAQIAAAAQGKIVSALNSVDVSKLNPLQMMQMFDIAVRNERLARGVPASVDAILAADTSPEMQSVTDEALEGKLTAWLRSRDPENTIELGEPSEADGAPDEGD